MTPLSATQVNPYVEGLAATVYCNFGADSQYSVSLSGWDQGSGVQFVCAQVDNTQNNVACYATINGVQSFIPPYSRSTFDCTGAYAINLNSTGATVAVTLYTVMQPTGTFQRTDSQNTLLTMSGIAGTVKTGDLVVIDSLGLISTASAPTVAGNNTTTGFQAATAFSTGVNSAQNVYSYDAMFDSVNQRAVITGTISGASAFIQTNSLTGVLSTANFSPSYGSYSYALVQTQNHYVVCVGPQLFWFSIAAQPVLQITSPSATNVTFGPVALIALGGDSVALVALDSTGTNALTLYLYTAGVQTQKIVLNANPSIYGFSYNAPVTKPVLMQRADGKIIYAQNTGVTIPYCVFDTSGNVEMIGAFANPAGAFNYQQLTGVNNGLSLGFVYNNAFFIPVKTSAAANTGRPQVLIYKSGAMSAITLDITGFQGNDSTCQIAGCVLSDGVVFMYRLYGDQANVYFVKVDDTGAIIARAKYAASCIMAIKIDNYNGRYITGIICNTGGYLGAILLDNNLNVLGNTQQIVTSSTLTNPPGIQLAAGYGGDNIALLGSVGNSMASTLALTGPPKSIYGVSKGNGQVSITGNSIINQKFQASASFNQNAATIVGNRGVITGNVAVLNGLA